MGVTKAFLQNVAVKQMPFRREFEIKIPGVRDSKWFMRASSTSGGGPSPAWVIGAVGCLLSGLAPGLGVPERELLALPGGGLATRLKAGVL